LRNAAPEDGRTPSLTHYRILRFSIWLALGIIHHEMRPKIHGRLLLTFGLTVVLAGWVVSVVFAGASGKMPPISVQTNVTYARDIRPILAANCFPCHGETRQKRHLRLDSLEAVLKGCEDGPVIFPGKSNQGDLILEICGLGDHDMPPLPSPPPILSRERFTNTPPALGPDGGPAPKPLTAAQIGLVRAWVAQGAK
jgi:hypothetical protein